MPKIVDPEERREEVVAAVFRLLAREGLERLSMREIAKEAGCTIGVINRWFQSKDELVNSALDKALRSALDRFESRTLNEHNNLQDFLSEMMPMDKVRADETRIWIAFWALAMSRPEMKTGHAGRYGSYREMLMKELSGLGQSTSLARKNADILITMVDGICVNAALDPRYWTTARQLQTLRQALKQIGIM